MKPPKAPSAGSPPALPKPTNYEVGYGKPPTQSQFKKGASGNPKGRPKGARNRPPHIPAERLKDIVLEEAYRVIGVRDGMREVKVPMAQAIVRALAVNAAKGQQRAQRLFTELLSATERDRKRERFEQVEALFDYKRTWDRELARRAALGIVAPDPIPHPDHIRIDLRTGAFEISGPMSEEKADLEVWRQYRDALEGGNVSLRSLLAECYYDVWTQEEMEEQIRGNDRCIKIIDKMLKSGRPLRLPILPEEVGL